MYFLSCIPASASMIFKEHALTAYRQPIDPNTLNLNVDIYQVSGKRRYMHVYAAHFIYALLPFCLYLLFINF